MIVKQLIFTSMLQNAKEKIRTEDNFYLLVITHVIQMYLQS